MAEELPGMTAALRQRRQARVAAAAATAVGGAAAGQRPEHVLSQGLPQATAAGFRESEGAARPALGRAEPMTELVEWGEGTDRPRPPEGATDAVVPLALVSARPHGEWKEPLLTHVVAPDNQVVAVPREDWVYGGYTRAEPPPGGGATLADTLRDRREQRKTERVLATAAAQAEMNAALNKREMAERLEQLRFEEGVLQERMAEAKAKLDEAQDVSRKAAAGRTDLSTAPWSHKRQVDFHRDGKKSVTRCVTKAQKHGHAAKKRAYAMPPEVDTAARLVAGGRVVVTPSLAATVMQRQATTAARRVEMKGGQGDGSGWRKDALVAKHDQFVAYAKAGARPGVDAGDRGGTKWSWLQWEGAGRGGRALAVQQRFARKRPTLQVLARSRRESEAKARAEIGLAARPRRRKGGLPAVRRLSLKTAAGYRAGYHESSERGANPTVISPWDAGHRQNVHDRKLAEAREWKGEVRPQTATQLDGVIANHRESIASDAAVALRRSAGSNWVSEALVRDENDRKTFGRTPSAVADARTGHEKRVARAVKEVDAGGERDKAHAKLVAKGKEGRGGWQRVAGAGGAAGVKQGKGLLDGRTAAAVGERAYWHKIRVEQARAGRDNRQKLFGSGILQAPTAAVDLSAGERAETQKDEEDRLREAEGGWIVPVAVAGNLQRTGTGLFPKGAASGVPLQASAVAAYVPRKPRLKQQPKSVLKTAKPGAAAAAAAAKRKPGWGGRAGGPRGERGPIPMLVPVDVNGPPGGRRKPKQAMGVALDPDGVAAQMRRFRTHVARARREGTPSVKDEADGTKGWAWKLKENKDIWRAQRERHVQVFEATKEKRHRKAPTSLGGGGGKHLYTTVTLAAAGGEAVGPHPRQRVEGRWSVAARELAEHRLRVTEMISLEAAKNEEAVMASEVPYRQLSKEDAAVATGIYPIGVGEALGVRLTGGGEFSLSDEEDAETDALLLKYAASMGDTWRDTDSEDEQNLPY